MKDYILCKADHNVKFTHFEHDKYNTEFIVNLLTLYGKFHLHKCKITNVTSNFMTFLCEFKEYIRSVKLITAKKSNKTVKLYSELIIYFYIFLIFLFLCIPL